MRRDIVGVLVGSRRKEVSCDAAVVSLAAAVVQYALTQSLMASLVGDDIQAVEKNAQYVCMFGCMLGQEGAMTWSSQWPRKSNSQKKGRVILTLLDEARDRKTCTI